MFSVLIIFLTILIPSIQSSKPTLKLTFEPDEKFYTVGSRVDISCELTNPNDRTEAPQLWYVDYKTGKRTPISRSLFKQPADDTPEVFKQNKNQHVEYLKKNNIRLKAIHLEDTGRYECNCPDCEEALGKEAKDLQVMKLVEPRLHIEPGWPIQENAKTTIRCTVDDFYPYVSHKIIRNHHEMTKDGKAVTPNSNTNPQKFSWDATVIPTADWHNTTLRCTVTEGNSEQHATKILDVLFTPRYLKCDERQHVNSTTDKSTIECSYSGNPAPKLAWLRQTDEKPITTDPGITIETKDEHHGKYKSIVTFERDKLITIPLTTTTKAPNGQPETTLAPKIKGDNYYQQLLNGGFIARLITNNNEVKESRKISIVNDVNQARSNPLNSSARKLIQTLSTSMTLFSSLVSLYMIQRH